MVIPRSRVNLEQHYGYVLSSLRRPVRIMVKRPKPKKNKKKTKMKLGNMYFRPSLPKSNTNPNPHQYEKSCHTVQLGLGFLCRSAR